MRRIFDLESNLKVVPDYKIERVYVVTRKIRWLPQIGIGIFVHSALLLKTCQGLFILEYSNRNRGTVVLSIMLDYGMSDGEFVHQGQIWHVANNGEDVVRHITVADAKQIMIDYSSQRNYAFTKWNCHMMQMETRKQMGLY